LLEMRHERPPPAPVCPTLHRKGEGCVGSFSAAIGGLLEKVRLLRPALRIVRIEHPALFVAESVRAAWNQHVEDFSRGSILFGLAHQMRKPNHAAGTFLAAHVDAPLAVERLVGATLGTVGKVSHVTLPLSVPRARGRARR